MNICKTGITSESYSLVCMFILCDSFTSDTNKMTQMMHIGNIQYCAFLSLSLHKKCLLNMRALLASHEH